MTNVRRYAIDVIEPLGAHVGSFDEQQKPWRVRRRGKEATLRAAAISEFCQHGYAGASIQNIADSLGMNKATLYHYVESKERLLADILDYAHDQIAAIMKEVDALSEAPIDRLRAFLERHLVWYLNNLELAKVAFHDWANLTGELLEAQRVRRRQFDDYVRNLIAAARDDGALRTDVDVPLAANFILGAINAVPSWYRKRGGKGPAAIAAVYADMSLSMLLRHK